MITIILLFIIGILLCFFCDEIIFLGHLGLIMVLGSFVFALFFLGYIIDVILGISPFTLMDFLFLYGPVFTTGSCG